MVPRVESRMGGSTYAGRRRVSHPRSSSRTTDSAQNVLEHIALIGIYPAVRLPRQPRSVTDTGQIFWSKLDRLPCTDCRIYASHLGWIRAFPQTSGRTMALCGLVGIELRRACCRWRVTSLALSIARWDLISTMPRFRRPPYKAGRPNFSGPIGSPALR
jgi:hypothetical protein